MLRRTDMDTIKALDARKADYGAPTRRYWRKTPFSRIYASLFKSFRANARLKTMMIEERVSTPVGVF